MLVEIPPYTGATEEWSFPPPTASTLTEGDIFLSGGTTLKGFGKAAGIPAASWAIRVVNAQLDMAYELNNSNMLFLAFDG